MNRFLKLITSVVACMSIGALGGWFTASSVRTWYVTLEKPFFSPPNWVFAPVWTVLYIMMGVSFYIIWTSKKGNRKKAVAFFFIQLVLNFLWSLVFFGLRLPLLAFFDIVLLWIAIVASILQFHKISKPSAYLLLPYFLWVSFASLLNLSIVILNR
ncbi:MAG: TspO/MBR family protein [Patescibacteria group bacterium]